MIGIGDLVHLVLVMLVVGAILGLLWWVLGYAETKFPGVPLFFKVARIVFVVLVAFMLIGMLMQLIGMPLVRFNDAAPVR